MPSSGIGSGLIYSGSDQSRLGTDPQQYLSNDRSSISPETGMLYSSDFRTMYSRTPRARHLDKLFDKLSDKPKPVRQTVWQTVSQTVWQTKNCLTNKKMSDKLSDLWQNFPTYCLTKYPTNCPTHCLTYCPTNCQTSCPTDVSWYYFFWNWMNWNSNFLQHKFKHLRMETAWCGHFLINLSTPATWKLLLLTRKTSGEKLSQ